MNGWIFGVALAVSFLSGVGVADVYYERKLDEQALSEAVARAEQGKRDYVKLLEAQNSVYAWRRSAVDLDAELRRVQSAAEDRDRRATSVTCRVDEGSVRRCEALLRESAELLAEGGKLLQRNAAVHDALASTVK